MSFSRFPADAGTPVDHDLTGLPPEIAAVVAAVWQRLGADRDVLVLGATGTGKSTVLDVAQAEAEARRTRVVRLGAVDAGGQEELGALRALPPFTTVSAGARSRDLPELVAMLEAEVRGGLLLIDDLDLLDAGSLAVVDRVVRGPEVSMIASAHTDLLTGPDTPARRLVAAGTLSEVRLQPLGFQGMSAMLDARLGGPADASLTSAVVAHTAGNPAAAAALVDAARWSGGIRLHGGRWIESRPLGAVPHDTVVHALTRRLPAPLLESLELLVCAGPVALPDALQLVGADTLSRLGDHERVTIFRTGDREVVEVSPPALTEALLDRVSPVRRHLLSHGASVVLGGDVEDDRRASRRFLDRLIGGNGTMADEHGRPAAERAAAAHAHAVVQDAERRAVWELEPTVGNALRYLDNLVASPAPEQLAEVFDRTLITSSDLLAQVALYRSRQAEWMLRQDDDLGHVTAMLGAWAEALGSDGRLLRAQAGLFALARSRCDPPLAVDEESDVVAVHRESARVLHALAGLLVERGRPDRALALMTGAPPFEPGSTHEHYLTNAVADAHALLDRPEDVERRTRALLEDAYTACDPLAIRSHALRLAEVLHLTGDRAAAWRVLAASLRLGPPSPFRGTSYERALSLGAVLRADAGDLRHAYELRAEAERYPRTYRPVLDSRRHCATAAILYAEGRTSEADELLWTQGCADADAGFLASALLCWTSRRSPYPPEQVARLRDVLARVRLPVLEPMVRLHEAMAEGGEEQLVAALRSAGRQAPDQLVAVALDLVDADRAARGLAPLTVAQAREIAPARVTARELWSETPAPSDALSQREREIALLARGGLANRDIADRLHISVRTVENHMYRVVRKLGLRKRSELQTVWDPAERQAAALEY